MMRTSFYKGIGIGLIAAIAIVAIFAAPAAAAEWKTLDGHKLCRGDHDDADWCEVREITLKADGEAIRVDGALNGGVSVEGWDRNEVRIRVQVRVWTKRGDEEEAEEIAGDIEIITDEDVIMAEGPKMGRKTGWSVSYEIMVPHKSDLEIETHNGGIAVEDVDGRIELDALNGGLRLIDLAGYVHGETTNGGLYVELSGNSWNGKGMDVRSTNGGVKMDVPEDYNADFETGTVNGSINVDFPITVQGSLNKHLKITLGDGGPRVRATTTNGGVKISRN